MLLVKNGKIMFQTYIRLLNSLINTVNYMLFENNEKLYNPFTMNELKVIIKELKNRKTSGYCNILIEFLKLSTERILKLLLDFYKLSSKEEPDYIEVVFGYNYTYA